MDSLKNNPQLLTRLGTRLVYADITGQEGTTTKQLFDTPPEGYTFVTRRKLSNAVAEAASASWKFRWLKQRANAVVPVNLAASRFLAKRRPAPSGAVLTYSESSVVFRDEPWVLWIEVATQVAGFSDVSLRRFRKVIERALGSANCRAILCHSEAARQSLYRHLSAETFERKISATPPGWPITPLEASAKPHAAPLRILFVAGNTMAARFKIKGGVESLEAFAALRRRFPDLELVVRSDVEPEIRKRYEGLPGLRIVSGLIPHGELAQLYRESDIYWYPAHCLMSVSMLEAMNYGLPIIATDYYDNPEYVEDGQTGITIPHHRHLPPWDTSERNVRKAIRTPDADFVRGLINSTALLIENAELRRRMGKAGRALLEKRFSLSEKNRRLKTILDQATAPISIEQLL
jgi:glycosyltransferase involved in cell wall biosynthesis